MIHTVAFHPELHPQPARSRGLAARPRLRGPSGRLGWHLTRQCFSRRPGAWNETPLTAVARSPVSPQPVLPSRELSRLTPQLLLSVTSICAAVEGVFRVGECSSPHPTSSLLPAAPADSPWRPVPPARSFPVSVSPVLVSCGDVASGRRAVTARWPASGTGLPGRAASALPGSVTFLKHKSSSLALTGSDVNLKLKRENSN